MTSASLRARTPVEKTPSAPPAEWTGGRMVKCGLPTRRAGQDGCLRKTMAERGVLEAQQCCRTASADHAADAAHRAGRAQLRFSVSVVGVPVTRRVV